MPEETVGYVRLRWTCRQCGTINPGPEKKCRGCGAAQPEDQTFELPEQQELVEEETGGGLECVVFQVEEFLAPEALPAVVADVHLVVALDVRVAAEDVAEQAGVGPHVAEQEDVAVGQQVFRVAYKLAECIEHVSSARPFRRR